MYIASDGRFLIFNCFKQPEQDIEHLAIKFYDPYSGNLEGPCLREASSNPGTSGNAVSGNPEKYTMQSSVDLQDTFLLKTLEALVTDRWILS